ncbi:hypothetical protein BDK51DRAFT_53000 [Blyttiomyces helicus]|uniref:Uncharacterized protein n=1 Tax=Blyttiomyces helicus TaxID=388810 RepID=A0A4P9WNK5_9FUNG|nr:hypothetical protein BDK51DRAFT_53000 [Blyttiomyces helicus]|eukprot:RKO94711.1 hypothetical protein BDK51DRAFT_53000 [Blyttiomyces helicus]
MSGYFKDFLSTQFLTDDEDRCGRPAVFGQSPIKCVNQAHLNQDNQKVSVDYISNKNHFEIYNDSQMNSNERYIPMVNMAADIVHPLHTKESTRDNFDKAFEEIGNKKAVREALKNVLDEMKIKTAIRNALEKNDFEISLRATNENNGKQDLNDKRLAIEAFSSKFIDEICNQFKEIAPNKQGNLEQAIRDRTIQFARVHEKNRVITIAYRLYPEAYDNVEYAASIFKTSTWGWGDKGCGNKASGSWNKNVKKSQVSTARERLQLRPLRAHFDLSEDVKRHLMHPIKKTKKERALWNKADEEEAKEWIACRKHLDSIIATFIRKLLLKTGVCAKERLCNSTSVSDH